MTYESKPYALFKNIPKERYTSYKDRHIPIHTSNLEAAKKADKTEKRLLEKEELKQRTQAFIKEKKIETSINNYFKLLNIV